MTQASPQQFEDLGAIKENVRFNEKAIDEIREDIKTIREEFKAETREIRADIKTLDGKINALARDFDTKISTLTEQYQSLGWKGLLGIITIVLANVVLKFIPNG